MLMPNHIAGALIGKEGVMIGEILMRTRCQMQISEVDTFFPGTTDRIVVMGGSMEGLEECIKMSLKRLKEVSSKADRTEKSQLLCKLAVPSSAVSGLIGHQGDKVKKLSDQMNCRINMSGRVEGMKERLVLICGEYGHLVKAVIAIAREIQGDPHLKDNLHMKYEIRLPLGAWSGDKIQPADPGVPLIPPDHAQCYTKREIIEYLHKAAPREILLKHNLLGNMKNTLKSKGSETLREALRDTMDSRLLMSPPEGLNIRERPTSDIQPLEGELSGETQASLHGLQIKTPPSALPVGEVRRLPVGPIRREAVEASDSAPAPPPPSASMLLPSLLQPHTAGAGPCCASPKAAVQIPVAPATTQQLVPPSPVAKRDVATEKSMALSADTNAATKSPVVATATQQRMSCVVPTPVAKRIMAIEKSMALSADIAAVATAQGPSSCSGSSSQSCSRPDSEGAANGISGGAMRPETADSDERSGSLIIPALDQHRGAAAAALPAPAPPAPGPAPHAPAASPATAPAAPVWHPQPGAAWSSPPTTSHQPSAWHPQPGAAWSSPPPTSHSPSTPSLEKPTLPSVELRRAAAQQERSAVAAFAQLHGADRSAQESMAPEGVERSQGLNEANPELEVDSGEQKLEVKRAKADHVVVTTCDSAAAPPEAIPEVDAKGQVVGVNSDGLRNGSSASTKLAPTVEECDSPANSSIDSGLLDELGVTFDPGLDDLVANPDAEQIEAVEQGFFYSVFSIIASIEKTMAGMLGGCRENVGSQEAAQAEAVAASFHAPAASVSWPATQPHPSEDLANPWSPSVVHSQAAAPSQPSSAKRPPSPRSARAMRAREANWEQRALSRPDTKLGLEDPPPRVCSSASMEKFTSRFCTLGVFQDWVSPPAPQARPWPDVARLSPQVPSEGGLCFDDSDDDVLHL